MITRMYPNAKGDVQTVTMSKDEWDAISEDDLKAILGYDKASAPKATKGKKK